ncbi:MAG: MFS transporter [Anaerolineales bacterium]
MLRNRNFMLLFAATLISRAGDTFTFLALAVHIDSLYQDPGQAARALGLVMIAFVLPQVVFGLFAGTMVDRWDRKRVMVASDLLRALLVPTFLLLQSPGDLLLAAAVAFGVSSFSIFFYPARTALLPKVVDEDDLITANSWLQVGETIARLSGPILAGVAIGSFGIRVGFIIDSATFMVSGLLLLGLVGIKTRAPQAESGQLRSTMEELWEGIQYAASSKLLQGVAIGLALALLGIGAVDVLFVPFMREAFGAPPEGLGLLMTSQGVGMLVGGLLMGWIGTRVSSRMVAVAGLSLLGLGTAGIGLAPAYWAAVPLMVLVGLALTPLNAALQTILQQGVPQEILGRASSVVDISLSVAQLISMGGAGWIAGAIGLRPTYLLAGGLMVGGAVAMGLLLRRLTVGSIPAQSHEPAAAGG